MAWHRIHHRNVKARQWEQNKLTLLADNELITLFCTAAHCIEPKAELWQLVMCLDTPPHNLKSLLNFTNYAGTKLRQQRNKGIILWETQFSCCEL